MKKLKKSKSKYWDFINSNFGLWLLPSVMVGLITFWYTKFSESLNEKNLREKQIVKLDQEIEGRFYQLFSIQKRNQDSLLMRKRKRDSLMISKTSNFPEEQNVMKDFLFGFKENPVGERERFYSMYSEFKERNIVSLIIELSSLEENK